MKCKYCNKEFETKRKGNIYCSQTCNRSYWALKNKNKVLESRRDYKENHPNRVKRQQKKWERDNWDKLKEFHKNYQRKPEVKRKSKIRQNTRYNNEKTGVCLDCKRLVKTEFHHISYEPNIFIELCKNCHIKRIKRHKIEEDLK